MPYDKKYLWKVNNTVVIQHKGDGGGFQNFGSIRINGDNHSKVQHKGGRGDFAQWHVEKHGGNHSVVMFKSKKTGKYLRIHGDDHTVDVGGEGGPWCKFNVHHTDNEKGIVKLEAKKSGKYLAYKNGKGITFGAGGPKCAMKVWKD